MHENSRYAGSFSWLLVFFVAILVGCSKKPVVKGPIPPGDYVVLEGDDLSNVALRAYGDMSLWYCLLNANTEYKTRPQFRLEPGETLHIPEKAKLDRKLPKSEFPDKLPADYIIMPGDSLPFIADRCYGDTEQWMRIYEANRHRLSAKVKENPKLLTAGEVLRIPAKESGEHGARTGAKETAKGKGGDGK